MDKKLKRDNASSQKKFIASQSILFNYHSVVMVYFNLIFASCRFSLTNEL